MRLRNRLLLLPLLLAVVAAPTFLFAKGNSSDRVQFFQSINVGTDEEVGDVVCIFCSIHMAGTATGDVVAIMGSIVLDGTAKGDVVAVAGGIHLGEDASVAGDTVGIGGGVSKHPNASIKGELVSQTGAGVFAGLIISMILVPLLPVVLIVWLIVWLLRRDRPAPQAPVAYR